MVQFYNMTINDCCTVNVFEQKIPFEHLSYELILVITSCITIPWLYSYHCTTAKHMRSKINQTWCQLIMYTFMFIYGIYCMINQNMFDIITRPTDMYTYPSFKPYNNNNRITRLLYEIEISWYIASLLITLFTQHQSDFIAMLIHHIVTPIEVFGSWECGMSNTIQIYVYIIIAIYVTHYIDTFKCSLCIL